MANPYNKYIKQYQANNITTATPEKLMIMLFDGAIQFLQKAKSAIEEKNLKVRSENIESARKIIRELMRTIDLENGMPIQSKMNGNMGINSFGPQISPDGFNTNINMLGEDINSQF